MAKRAKGARRLLLGAQVVLFAIGASRSARAEDVDPSVARLRSELKEILRAPELKDSAVGVHVRSLTDGQTLFAASGEKLFNPASNMKLLTSAAALWHLSPTYRFKTEAKRDPKMKGGVVHGNLYLRGKGDPTLTTEELFGFVNDIALYGVKRIKGDLVVDDTFFDEKSEGPGWEQEKSDQAYAAPIGALSVNFGTYMIRVLPGDKRGLPAHVTVWPDVRSIEVISNVKTRGAGSRSRVWVGTTKRRDDGIQVTVRGMIASNDHYGKTIRRRIHNPSQFSGEMFKEMLRIRGIRVDGKIRRGVLPEKNVVHVATHYSRPLAEIVGILNKYSNNFVAEQILKTLGAEVRGSPGTWEKGCDVVASFLREVGIANKTFVLGNGSGLNDVNRLTPRQITQVLEAMYRRFEYRSEYVASLAVAGSSGTIVGRFENSPAVLRLRAKTGSLTGVSALSGYVVTRSGQVFAFSIMMNDYRGKARRMWRIQDKIGVALARFNATDMVAQERFLPIDGRVE